MSQPMAQSVNQFRKRIIRIHFIRVRADCSMRSFVAALIVLLATAPDLSYAQTPNPDPWCRSKPEAAFCRAVRGVRAGGWPAQTRSEVTAQNGMVVTSQPLAAQAGLQVLIRGGNAIDAAVATAGVLSLVEP